MKLAVTGANGYIGKRFIKLAAKQGHEVVAMSRRPINDHSVCQWIKYDLFSEKTPELPEDLDALIHLAADVKGESHAPNNYEIDSAKILIRACNVSNVKLVFISSQSAREDAPTSYGRVKWEIERVILASGGCVVRPGQVYGGLPGGLFGELVGLVTKFHFLPAFLPAPEVQPIHVDDLSKGILKILEPTYFSSRVIRLAESSPISFTHFLLSIATHRVRAFRIILPLPRNLIEMLVRTNPLGLAKKFGLDRLNSLFTLKRMETGEDLRFLELELRPLSSGMQLSDNSSRLLALEGTAMLTYVQGMKPKSALIRNYIRAIRELREGKVLPIPYFLLIFPSMFFLLEGRSADFSGDYNEFIWRLDAATSLTEATPEGAKQFLGLGGRSNLLSSIWLLGYALMREALARVARLLISPLLKNILCANLKNK